MVDRKRGPCCHRRASFSVDLPRFGGEGLKLLRAVAAERRGCAGANGNVEALHRTILDECWRPAIARYLYVRLTGLRRELDTYLHFYNFDRVHHGRLTARY